MTEVRARIPRILVVEDEYLLAEDVRMALLESGKSIIGPFSKVDEAMRAIAADREIDGAVLDINVGGEKVYAVADELGRLGIPYVFTTGYDASAIPSAYRDVPRWEKPFDALALVGSLLTKQAQGA